MQTRNFITIGQGNDGDERNEETGEGQVLE